MLEQMDVFLPRVEKMGRIVKTAIWRRTRLGRSQGLVVKEFAAFGIIYR